MPFSEARPSWRIAFLGQGGVHCISQSSYTTAAVPDLKFDLNKEGTQNEDTLTGVIRGGSESCCKIPLSE